MKKLISLLAALLVLGGLTACSAASEEKADTILIGVN